MIDIENYLRDKRVYIFGAAIFGRIMAEYFIENGIEFEGFLVSDTKGKTVNVLGKPVICLSDLTCSTELIVLVCVDDAYKDDIVLTLKKVGIDDYVTFSNGDFDVIEKSLAYNVDRCESKCVYVLVYHRVGVYSNDTWKLAISEKLFDEQLEYIKRNYSILRFDDDWDSIDENSVVITFDDGYSDFYYKALPILKKHRIPATVFVSTGNIDSINEFWWDELERLFISTDKKEILYNDTLYDLSSGSKIEDALFDIHPYLKGLTRIRRNGEIEKLKEILGDCDVRTDYRSLSSEELKELSKEELITIGGHTVSHPCLAMESSGNQLQEIMESKAYIENRINRHISCFSYPFGGKGDFTSETIEIALSCGYSKIAAAIPGVTDGNYTNGYIPRINIAQEDNLSDSIRCLRKVKCLYHDKIV